MPISAENRKRYPPNWREIRAAILARAGNKCERCGVPNREIIVRRRDDPSQWEIEAHLLLVESFDIEWEEYGEPVEVVLTIAHLDHTPEHNEPENLAGLCQRCHLLHDVKEHKRSRRVNAARRSGQLTMGEGEMD